MRKMNLKFYAMAALLGGVSLLVNSCGGADECDFSQQLKQYYNKDIVKNSSDKGCSAYFDLSDGVVLAYKNNKDAASFLNATVQRLTSSDSCNVFSMASDQITPLELKQTGLYNKIMDPK